MSHLVLLAFVMALLPGTPLRSRELTPIAPSAIAAELAAAHRATFGRAPARSRLALAVALVAYENGLGANVYNHNLGNIGPAPGEPRFLHGDRGYYRAFDDFDEAARGFWGYFKARCAGALGAFDIGDPELAAEALGRCGYHRTPVETYAAGLRSLLGLAWRVTGPP